MRLPVSRARYDLLEHNSREFVAQLRADLAMADVRTEHAEQRAQTAEARLQDMTEKYHALRFQRIEGTNAVAAVETPASPVPVVREQDELKALIAEVCGRDYPKRAMMLRQLAVDRAAKVADSEIRSRILNGVTADGVPA